jgi:enoyl-CoA hydratase/carnithine racemase
VLADGKKTASRVRMTLMTGRRMSGREAVNLGLATRAVPAHELEAATLALAQEIARADPDALAAMKSMARRALDLPLKDGLWLERWTQHRYRTESPELEAGVRGFASPGPSNSSC